MGNLEISSRAFPLVSMPGVKTPKVAMMCIEANTTKVDYRLEAAYTYPVKNSAKIQAKRPMLAASPEPVPLILVEYSSEI